MFDHAILAYETFATNITGERLLACVQAHVPPQVRLVVELLGANLAFVGLVSLMFGHVLLQKSKRKVQIPMSKFNIFLRNT